MEFEFDEDKLYEISHSEFFRSSWEKSVKALPDEFFKASTRLSLLDCLLESAGLATAYKGSLRELAKELRLISKELRELIEREFSDD